MAAAHDEPSLMQNIGAFFGHIIHAIRDDEPASPATKASEEPRAHAPRSETREVQRDVQEARVGEYILTRTTIDAVRRADASNETRDEPHD